MNFEPIAIIGQSCVLPGALNPDELWDIVLSGKDVLSSVPDGYWRVDPRLVMAQSPKNAQDLTWTDRGGYVQGFESVFYPEGFAVSADEILEFDPLVHWLLHSGREALRDAGYGEKPLKKRCGVFIGNLSYPSHSLTELSEAIWLDSLEDEFMEGKARELTGAGKPHILNRFMSGLPAHILARALELDAGAFALDAACASSLYAIKLACDMLHDRKADMMLAGGVNRADDLILHIGFCSLQAMSHTGQSRPFHRDADGLVPAEGAGFVLLKRLDDAIAAGDNILGLIRGAGLSNDGRGHGLLAPSEEGQERAIIDAYKLSGLTPADISLVECHATGTPIGDVVEIRSLGRVYKDERNVPIGSIKSNMGHPITVSGIAGLLKVLGAMKAGIRPPTLHVEEPLEQLNDSPFRLLTEAEPWDCEKPRRAAVNNFGFGGNNAHIIVEEWDESLHKKTKKNKVINKDEIAIVGMGAVVADTTGVADFARALFSGNSHLREQKDGGIAGFTESIDLPLMGLRFPPADLDQTLPQQLLVLKAAMEAIAEVDGLSGERAGVLVGMGCDGEVARSGACWRMPQWAKDWAKPSDISNINDWIANARDHISPVRKAAAILGAMPNIIANRICSQFDLRGLSFTVSSEELSGVRCLDLAIRAIRNNEIDAAVVGAVDVSCEPVQRSAAMEVLGENRHIPGDAAVVLILKRLEDARKDHNRVYAIIKDDIKADPEFKFGLSEGLMSLTPIFGHAHAASGLLHIAASALACYHRVLPADEGKKAAPWLTSQDKRYAEISIDALGGEFSTTILTEDKDSESGPLSLESIPRLYIYSGGNRQEVIHNLIHEKESDEGPARLALVAENEGELADLRNMAKRLLENGNIDNEYIEMGKGIYFREKPIDGELAFVFTGSAGAYAGMGRELLLAFPELMDDIHSSFSLMKETAGWIYDADSDGMQTPERMLWASSFLSQLHARVTQNILGLAPSAVLGFSSGESNSLFAMGAWKDMDQMAREFQEMGVFTREVGGEFTVIREAWKHYGITDVNWVNWGIMAPENEALAAIESEPLVYLIIINAPGEVVIGGQAEACDRVLDRLGKQRAYRLPYNMANHCPPLKAYEDKWRKLHHRRTFPVPNVRFYSGATCSYYQPTADLAADALLGMATNTLNFPLMVENAWKDGARIFIEHGPRDSCTKWINKTLGQREHMAISLDRNGSSSFIQLIHAMAQLTVSGISVNFKSVIDRSISMNTRREVINLKDSSNQSATRNYPIHPPEFQLPPIAQNKEKKSMEIAMVSPGERMHPQENALNEREKQVMAPAPWLPPVMEEVGIINKRDESSSAYSNEGTLIQQDSAQPAEMRFQPDIHSGNNSPMRAILNEIVSLNKLTSSTHRDFLAQQSRVQQQFLESRQNALSILANASGMGIAPLGISEHSENNFFPSLPKEAESPAPVSDESAENITGMGSLSPIETERQSSPQYVEEETTGASITEKPLKTPLGDMKPISKLEKESSVQSAIARQFTKPEPKEPVGPAFSREQLEILASGKISDVLGPLFKIQDDYHRQVRLPEYPLLLADRVTGLDAEPGAMGKGIIWTETDVKKDAWYINDIYMPAGVTVEAGQCDLLLISWLGADFKNKGERVYRLLGCDLVYYGTPPKAGDTLCYEIYIDGHANVGDVRIFFFHYDCRINGEMRLSVRNAQAGFFSDEELGNSGGVLWEPETGEYNDDARLDPPAVRCARSEFSADQVQAFSEGRVYECFGPGFELTETHTKTPKLQSGQMLLLDRVTHFDPKGGPWKRGYLRAEHDISPDAWFLVCHFKNDPCMPGTLMSDACLQTLIVYMTAMGYTINKDGWRFDPVPDEIYHIICRGQVTPKSRNLSYEVFVEEVIDGPYPTVYADILATCDGLKILHIRRLGVRLVPDWPLDCRPEIFEGHVEKKPVASLDDFQFGYKSLMACAWGRPSDAFGESAVVFDGPRHVARLPGPPYHFMTRIAKLEAGIGNMKSGESIEAEYDIPSDAWYFDENGNRTMPFCVLMEIALQPCGWLAVFEGCPSSAENDLYFRNLDGAGAITSEIFPDSGSIRTRTTLTNIARLSGVILVNFDVECFVEDTSVYNMKTGFGFFPKEALDQQVGMPATDEEKKWLDEPCEFFVDLKPRPDRYCNNELRVPKPMLLMIDRVTGYWPEGGDHKLGRLRAEKTVNVSEWFFKAHFFRDPVQPGSLGVESMVQLLQFYMIHEEMDKGINQPRFEPIAINKPTTWKYRGQVTPSGKRISVEMNITERGKDEKGPYAVAEAWLWIDELRIFHVIDLGMRIVSGYPQSLNKKDDVNSEIDNISEYTSYSNTEDNRIKSIREEVAHKAGVQPSTVNLSKDGRKAVCESMPLNIYPLSENNKGDIKVGEPFLDMERILGYGRSLLNIGPWIGENFTRGLYERFVRQIILEYPEAFENIRGRSALFLGNHQVQIESMLFPMMTQALTGIRTVTIAKSDHKTGWIGAFNNIIYSYPGIQYPRNIIYFDQKERKSMFSILDQLKTGIMDEGISVFLHVEGKLGLSCRNPVKMLSSVFIDLAQETNIPIVPVRFVGGLSIDKMKSTLDFPIDYCRQDYYIGRPILPEKLQALPYAERRKFVINAINNLGISNDDETPNHPDYVFMNEVKSWMTQTGTTEVKSVLFKILENTAYELTEEAQMLIEGMKEGRLLIENNEKGRWVSEFACWLLGKNVIKVEYKAD